MQPSLGTGLLEVRVLGPLEVARGAQRVELGAAKERALLALLALEAGRVISADRLIEELWTGSPPASAPGSLRVLVSRLRKAFATVGSEELIVTRSPGYLLQVEAEQVDAGRFESLLSRGRAEAASGAAQSASATLRDALALWRGRPLVDVSGCPTVEAEAARLEEARLRALEDRIWADLACGRHGVLLAELEALVAAHPFQERLWAARILAMYRCGRQSDALATYRELRARLVEELGIEPSPELRELEQAVLSQDPKLTLTPEQRPPAGGTVTLLFTDFAGSTELLDRVGDDAAEQLRREYFGLLRGAIAAHRGEEVKTLGDGVMVAFESSVRALSCAADMEEAVERHNDADPNGHLGLRVGVNAGEVISEEDDYFGSTVVIAERLCERAEGGQVLVSDLVRGLAGKVGGHRFRELGTLSLKGLADPVRTYELMWRATDIAPPSPSPIAAESSPPKTADPAGGLPEMPRALSAQRERRIVGRSSELERLRRRLAAAREGALQLSVVGGEAGVGKTRVAAELAYEAHQQGTMVLFGQAQEENLVPFQPFVEALRTYVSHASVPALQRHLDERMAVELSRLLPEVQRRLPNVPEPPSTEADTARFRLFEAVRLFLSSIARECPLLLVLDDLQWADKPALLLLRHIFRSAENAPLLVLVLYRDPEVPRGHPLAATLADLRRESPFEEIALAGLDQRDVQEMIRDWAGEDPPAAFAEAVWSETDGNPFFVQEVLRHLLQVGAITEGDGRFMPELSLADAGIPQSVQEAISRRLAHLSDDAREVLSVASVIGREFQLSLLKRVSTLSSDDLLGALEEAAGARVVLELSGITGRFRFAHTLTRDALYNQLRRGRRVELHLRIGEALEELHASNLGPYLAEVAHHFLEGAVARDAAKAIDYAEQAAQHADGQLAFEEAASHNERALDAMDFMDQSDDERRCELLLALGEAHRKAGESAHAREAFESAAGVARHVGSATMLGRSALGLGEVGFGAAWWAEPGWVDSRLVARLEEALEALGDADTLLRAQVCGRLARELVWAPEHGERRIELAREAVAIMRRLGDPTELAMALGALGLAMHGPDTQGEVLDVAEEALAAAEQVEDRELTLDVHALYLPAVVFPRGDRAEIHSWVERGLGLADELRQIHHRWWAAFMRAMTAMLDGRLDDAERLAGEALALGQRAEDQTALQLYAGQIFLMRMLQGRLAEVVPGARGFAARYPGLPVWRHGVTVARLSAGEREQARAELNRVASEGLRAVPHDAYWWTTMVLLSGAATTLGERRHADELYERLRPHADRYEIIPPGMGSIGPVALHLGLLAATLGRSGDALGHFRKALAMTERMRDRPWEAAARFALGSVLVVAGRSEDADDARELLRAAADQSTELGMASPLELPWLAEPLLALARDKGTESALRSALSQSAVAGRPQRPTSGSRRQRARARALRSRAALTADRGKSAVRHTSIGAMSRLVKRASDAEIERRLASPAAQRAVFAVMALSLQRDKAYGFQGEIVYELKRAGGDAVDAWTVSVRDNRASARRGAAASPAATIRLALPDFARIVAGQLDPVSALIDGVVEVEGDVSLASRLVEMFGGRVPV